MLRLVRQNLSERKEFRKCVVDFLEESLCFRDYRILPAKLFGKVNEIAVHQMLDGDSMEYDVENAIYNFERDGFPQIIFYI